MTLHAQFKYPLIGEVYMMKFTGTGSEQSGYRPGLIIQNNIGNQFSPNVISLPFTSSLKKQGMPTHVVVYAEDSGLDRDSMVICENPERMSKDRIGKYITTLSSEYMSLIAEAYLLASSVISFINPDMLSSIWKKAAELNSLS